MRFKTAAVAALGAVAAAIFYKRSEHEKKTVKTEYYKLITDKLSGDLRLVFISDLHSRSFGPDNEELTDRIKELHPDAVLIGGDMMTCGKRTDKAPLMDVTVNLLDKLFEAGLPVYYAEGNHETRMFERFAGTYEKWKLRYNDSINPLMHYLDDAYALLPEKAGVKGSRARVFGITHGGEFYERRKPGINNKHVMPENYIEDKIGYPRKDEFTILLMHSPLYLKEAAKWGADLVLSGHFHGGTIRLPFIGGLMTPQLQFFVKECAGVHRDGDTTMIVNRGLGTHSINIRFNDFPEISCIDITGTKEEDGNNI